MGGRGEKQERPQEVGDGFISDGRAAVRLPQITRASGGRWKAERCFGKSISSCCFPASLSKAALAAAGCDFAGKINVGWSKRQLELQTPESSHLNISMMCHQQRAVASKPSQERCKR